MNNENQSVQDGPLTLNDMRPKGVGLLYDDQMLEPRCIWVPTYPECPSRLKASIDRCRYYNLVERCIQIPTRIATEEEILLLHSKEYYDLIKSSSTMTVDELKVLSGKFDAAYFHPKTYASAMMAAGCAIEAIDQVVGGKVRHSMALVRPPGHHAMRTESSGYCIFNNAALAAKYAIDRLGLKRVLVVDWDLHHGQGTQYMFYEDPRVVYFSIHRYENGTFWPYLRQSDYDFVGKGFNINVPFNKVGMKDSDYLAIMQQVLMPLACEFNPELVIVSSGYDAAIGDAEGRSELTPAIYAHFTHMMKGLAGGKVCIIFEGGYCLKSLAEGVALTLKTLLDDPCPLLQPLTPVMDSTRESILHVIRVLRPFWKCLAYQEDARSDDDLPDFFKNIEIPKKGVAFFTDQTRPAFFALDGYESYLDEENTACDKIIDDIIKNTSLYKPPNRTCVTYDENMCLHKFGDNIDDHPEKPSRLTRIFSALQDSGILNRCKVLPSRTATDEELCLVHTKDHVEKVKSFETMSDEQLEAQESSLSSIYLSKDVFRCASLAAGCTLNVVDEVVTGQSLNGLAIVRPPGHHAESDSPMGFCFFNSVAIAAKYAQRRHGVKKVLIVDWDIHHGNGTQHAFDEDPSVLYISIHRGKGAYPDVDDKYAADVGHGPGKGFNVNIVWSRGGMSDCDYLAAFQQVILPVAYEFAPDLVLVSAGFDAAVGDHLGGCRVTPNGFGQMTHLLSSLANGRIILVLEGGYNLAVMPDCVTSCTSVLLGDAVPFVKLPSSASAVESILTTVDVHKAYWKSLSYRVKMPTRDQTLAWLSSLGHKTGHERQEDKLTIAMDTLEISTEQSMPSDQSAVCEASGDSELLGATGGKDVNMQETVGLHQMLQSLAQGQDSLELHAVEPFLYCPHVDAVQPVPASGLGSNQECLQCGALGENWVCLTCYEVHCSRYHSAHMVEHNHLSKHPIALSYADLSVWCYSCDTYIHHSRVMEAKEKAYEDKFHETMPGTN